MISDLRLPRLHATARTAMAALLVAATAALLAACDKVPLTAPSSATIKLYSNTPIVPINGTAQITATVIQGGGVAVHNGTVVSFTTSLGTIQPSDAATQDGKVTVTFVAGTQSGTAIINAYSGAASTTGSGTPGGTTPGTPTNTGGGVTLLVGAAAAAAVVVTASPGTVSGAGGDSVITATVLDANNNALPGVPVSFSADLGTWQSATTVTTSSSGQASATLHTFQTATVTVTAGPKITGTTKVTAAAVPTITITAPSATPTVGLSANFTVNIAVGAGGAPITRASINFGDGSSANLGAATGSITIPHTYKKADNYTVTATATDASGQTATMSVPVDVFPAIPFPVTLTAPSGKSGVSLTLSATPGSGAPAILNYVWSFGDGTTETTTANTVPHTYTLPLGTTVPQQFVVTVTATGADGRTGTGSAVVVITP